MTKLTYTNDQQIINDAAQMLIEAHLSWSGSNKNMPSKDLDNVHSLVMEAYLDANFTDAEWDALGVKGMLSEQKKATKLFDEAAQLADRKWQAAMTLLSL